MLLVGLHPEPQGGDAANDDATMAVEDDEGEPFAAQKRACAELGSAMMALLPGIDANDQDKTMATLGFYLSVLSNCVRFTGVEAPDQEGALQLGFCAEDFVIGFLQRIFGAIGDLEVTAGSADGTIGSAEYASLHCMRPAHRS
jgi:hypothetical protein